MLSTRLRARHMKSNVKSQAEVEEEELKKVKPFKARPVNRKVQITN
jgi:hypothetical protein